MTREERIKRIERAMQFEREQFNWLSDHEWGASDDKKIELRTHWSAAIRQHDRLIATYQSILNDLKPDRRDRI